MGGHRKRSRPHDERRRDNQLGVGETLSRLRSEGEDALPRDRNNEPRNNGQNDEDNEGDWQTAESKRAKKRRRQDEAGTDGHRDSKNYPSISHSANARLQTFVKVSDLQNLVLYLLADGTAPQWCAVRHNNSFRKVVVLMVPGLEAGMFDGTIPCEADSDAAIPEATRKADVESTTNDPDRVKPVRISPDDYYPVRLRSQRLPEPLKPFSDFFDHIWPIKAPGDDKYGKMFSPLAGMLSAPVPKTKEEKKAKGPQLPSEGRNWQDKHTPVTDLLASADEMADDGVVLHPVHIVGEAARNAEMTRRIDKKRTSADGWVDIPNIPDLAAGEPPQQDIKDAVTAGRKVLALDCEMCLVSPPGQSHVFRLTRATIIDWNGEVVMDRLVKPAEPITDYLTPYSGITAAKLEGVTTTVADVQSELLKIITPQTILVGHSINGDLNALQITHPFIIDTTFLYPHPRGPPLKSSLKWLAQKYLGREIQKGHGSTGHDSVEDARATLDLVKQKCEKGKAWGTPEAHNESIFARLARHHRPTRDKLDPQGPEENRVGAVVDWGDPTRGYGSAAQIAIGAESDAEVVAGVIRALNGDDSDGPDIVAAPPSSLTSPRQKKSVPKGGCDFVWARLRELEAHRGWWNRTKALDTEALRTTTKSSMTTVPLATQLAQLAEQIATIWAALPPATAFVIYSGSGDPQPLTRMQDLQKTFKEEYKTKKWDELSVKWTDEEEQQLRRACETTRRGIGFIGVK